MSRLATSALSVLIAPVVIVALILNWGDPNGLTWISRNLVERAEV